VTSVPDGTAKSDISV
jgi:3-oxoacyl-[acyl-carrier protein] reductase